MSPVNALRTLWSEGRTALGAFVFTRLDPVMVEALGGGGYDYVCIDLQHGLMSFEQALAMLQALAGKATVPLVRVPSGDPAIICRVLDAGALGVIIPMVNTADQARQAVAACRYAPQGVRSFGPIRAGVVHGRGYASAANELVLCIPMIETAEAVENLAEILAVPGIDALYVGPTDLALTLGQPPLLDNNGPFAEAMVAIVAAARTAGVVAGVHASAALAAPRAEAGFRMITVAHDLGVITAGFAAELRHARDAPPAGTAPAGAY